MTRPAPLPAAEGTLDHVGLSVRDLEAQRAWYAEGFGLRASTAFEVVPLGLRGTFLVDDETGWALELLQKLGSVAPPPAPDPQTSLLTQGYRHMCLRVRDVDAVHHRLLRLGATECMAPQPSPEPGVRMSFVADPEGNLIELLDRAHPVGAQDRP